MAGQTVRSGDVDKTPEYVVNFDPANLEPIPEGYEPQKGDRITVYYDAPGHYSEDTPVKKDELEVLGPVEMICGVYTGGRRWNAPAIPVYEPTNEDDPICWLSSSHLKFSAGQKSQFSPQYILYTVNADRGKQVNGYMGFSGMRGIEVTPAEENILVLEETEI